jgi:RND family efflux transporter MFP subunit
MLERTTENNCIIMKLKFTLLSACVLAAAVLLSGCGRKTAPPAAPMVNVSRPALEQVTNYIDLTGSVTASQTVDLVARVSGYLQSVNFQDGAFVEQGQLFVIEPEPYEQQLKLAQAALLQAQSEYDRQTALMKENATSAANVEKWLSQRDQAAAQVELAKLNLGYTRITAPFSGRIGRHLMDPGNMVGATGITKLATLDQIEPIYVYFNLNERDALRIRTAMRELGITPGSRVGKAPVLVGLQNEDGYSHQGTLDFVDNNVSASSGTVLMRAVLPNADMALFPGLFARVRIPLGKPKPMLVVPNCAIGNDQEGDYVLVADAGNIVARRAVVKGPLLDGRCAIISGLVPTDRVIVNGLMRAKPGAKVTPMEETPATPAR